LGFAEQLIDLGQERFSFLTRKGPRPRVHERGL
jgi:hypothetical protein